MPKNSYVPSMSQPITYFREEKILGHQCVDGSVRGYSCLLCSDCRGQGTYDQWVEDSGEPSG